MVTMRYETFLLSLTDMQRRVGPSLPVDNIRTQGGVNIDGGILSIGGYEDNLLNQQVDVIYKFDQETYEWSLLEERLKIPRGGKFGVVALPDEFLHCQ